MDEKKEAQNPAQSAAAAAPPPAAPPPAPPPVDPPQVAQNAAAEGDQSREKMGTSDFIMSVATIVIAAGTIVSAAAIVLQWREMVGGGTQTDKIINAAGGIEGAQKQLVLDNKTVLGDNRTALAEVLKENREELAKALRQNRDALKAQTATLNGQLAAMQNQTDISERPWIKITPSIAQPLTFDVMRNAGPVATMTTENVIENVGQSVALNVLSWEDVIPVDPNGSLQTARTRQDEWCGAHRHLQKGEMTGGVLFPHDPSIERMGMGPLMTKVNEARAKNTLVPGKVAFVLVGCVSYRSSFEPQAAPSHQTRFIYWLGIPQDWGGFQSFIDPVGTASELRLIQMPDGFTAD
jgi:gas vesicle protein